jgi:hypothetical protein
MTHSENNHSMSGYSMLVVFVLAVLVSGCALLLGDTAERDMAKLTRDPCPDLSGRYTLMSMTKNLNTSDYVQVIHPNCPEALIDKLPLMNSDQVGNVLKVFVNPNTRTWKSCHSEIFDRQRINNSYVELRQTDGNEYVVSVYLSSNQLLGKFQTKLLGTNSICHDNKYYTFLQEPSAHMVGDDWAFSTKRSSGEMMFYRSESGALIRENVGRTKVIVLGAIPTTQPESRIIMAFPAVP